MSQQHPDPAGQLGPKPPAGATGIKVMCVQSGCAQQAAWQAPIPPFRAKFPKSFPGASMLGPKMVRFRHCRGGG